MQSAMTLAPSMSIPSAFSISQQHYNSDHSNSSDSSIEEIEAPGSRPE
jgi:hypothetical protein